MSVLLDIRNLSIRFLNEKVENEVAHDISFQIEKGDIVGLVGESGSGKSVTALSLMGILPSSKCRTQGAVYLHEGDKKVELLSLPEEKIRLYRGNTLGMIFQEPMTSLNPVYTCGEQVAEGIRIHKKVSGKEATRQVIDLFEQVRLPDPVQMYHRYPHQLSGGQKQRVMIAMAISCQPRLIIADEPTTALDVTVQKAILDLLKDLQRQSNISVLFITHDLGVIKAIANKVAVMYKGRIVEHGGIESVFFNPQHPYTKGLLACRPPTDRVLKKLPVMSDFIQIKDGNLVSRNTDLEDLIRSLEVKPEEKPVLKSGKDREPVLRVKDLVVQFPGKKNFFGKIMNWTKAVNGVSFELGKGEILGLAGESGCGKTTLGRTILQLIAPASGEVWYRDVNLCALPKNALRKLRPRLQLIFQDPYSALNPRLTIGEALMEPMKVHNLLKNDRERKHKIRELLEKVDLNPEMIKKYPHEFSGGQRQRICIARALALQPEFIICDESVSALDVSVQAQVLNLLLQLKEEFHFSCIFISHDLSVVKFMCDRIMVMNKGKIEEIGPSEQVYHHPQTPYTRQLIAAIPG